MTSNVWSELLLSIVSGKVCAAKAWNRKGISFSSNSVAVSDRGREAQSWYWVWHWAASHKRETLLWRYMRWPLLQGESLFFPFCWAWTLSPGVSHPLSSAELLCGSVQHTQLGWESCLSRRWMWELLCSVDFHQLRTVLKLSSWWTHFPLL